MLLAWIFLFQSISATSKHFLIRFSSSTIFIILFFYCFNLRWKNNTTSATKEHWGIYLMEMSYRISNYCNIKREIERDGKEREMEKCYFIEKYGNKKKKVEFHRSRYVCLLALFCSYYYIYLIITTWSLCWP